jgi:prepilin-type N-terminal cleavage/methylation domain-containing protein
VAAVMPRTSLKSSDRGFSLIEVLVAVTLGLTVMALTVGGFGQALNTIRGDASMNVVLWQLKLAREAAINQRRFVEIRFTDPNFLSVVRRDIPGGETVLSTAVLEHQTEFRLFPDVPDTPDSFGNDDAVDFGGADAVMFNAAGQLVDDAGVLVNGTVFIGKADEPMTARAVTVFGPTATLRTYSWNGAIWRH